MVPTDVLARHPRAPADEAVTPGKPGLATTVLLAAFVGWHFS